MKRAKALISSAGVRANDKIPGDSTLEESGQIKAYSQPQNVSVPEIHQAELSKHGADSANSEGNLAPQIVGDRATGGGFIHRFFWGLQQALATENVDTGAISPFIIPVNVPLNLPRDIKLNLAAPHQDEDGDPNSYGYSYGYGKDGEGEDESGNWNGGGRGGGGATCEVRVIGYRGGSGAVLGLGFRICFRRRLELLLREKNKENNLKQRTCREREVFLGRKTTLDSASSPIKITADKDQRETFLDGHCGAPGESGRTVKLPSQWCGPGVKEQRGRVRTSRRPPCNEFRQDTVARRRGVVEVEWHTGPVARPTGRAAPQSSNLKCRGGGAEPFVDFARCMDGCEKKDVVWTFASNHFSNTVNVVQVFAGIIVKFPMPGAGHLTQISLRFFALSVLRSHLQFLRALSSKWRAVGGHNCYSNPFNACSYFARVCTEIVGKADLLGITRRIDFQGNLYLIRLTLASRQSYHNFRSLEFPSSLQLVRKFNALRCR
ncbi:hypothetical protein B0H16DRAFT_1696378 [Mycena metata]|uniref:Uncharacterized protein n=1 Tax=Mycena metata TaxID=1033252 RepID=A0AAD7I2L4_9AGAR|nr:hypothetical protein B0H16DRAFT_1696378 [Mycena metata]